MQTPTTASPSTATGLRWRPVSAAGAAVDAAAVVLAYLLALAAWSQPLRADDAATVGAIALLSLPGSVPLRPLSRAVLARLVAQWLVLVLALVAGGALAQGRFAQPMLLADHPLLLSWGAAALAAVLLARVATPVLLAAHERRSRRRKVVIVGINEAAVRLGRAIRQGRGRGQQLAGFFDDRGAERAPLPDDCARVGRLGDVGDYVRRHRIGRVYLALPLSSSARVQALLRETQDSTASVYVVPDIDVAQPIQCRAAVLAGVPLVAVCESPFDGAAAVLKRGLDLGLTIAALPLLLPLMAVIAALVRTTSRGPVFFRQRRYGLEGDEILVWKFRTMTTLEDGCTSFRPATADDDRVTPVGRFLRRTSLDELPQFLNVLGGSMSIVGPRPHALAVNEQCRKLIPRYMLRHKVKPGITGWAQVNGLRGGDDIAALRRRTECDLHYLRTWSLGLDLLIIWKTALLLVRGDANAY